MSLYKRGNIWWSKVMRAGELKVQSTGCANINDAEKVEAKFKVDLQLAKVGLGDSPSLKITVKDFEEQLFNYIHTHRPKSERVYRAHWKPIAMFLGHTELAAINSTIIQKFINWRMLREDIDPATINASLRLLKRALNLAAEWNIIPQPKKKLITMLPGESQREYVISENVLTRISELAPLWMQRLLPFLIDTGLRIGECCNLQWTHVRLKAHKDAPHGSIRITEGKSKYAQRTIPLSKRAQEKLRELHQEANGSPYVWIAQENKLAKMSKHTASSTFRRICKGKKGKAGKIVGGLGLPKDCCIHSTRHTFCTRLAEGGSSALTIRDLAGHSSVTISERYIHGSGSKANAIATMCDVENV